MDFEKEDVELYDEYLLFIRRKIIDEFALSVEDPYDLELDIAEKLIDGMRFSFKVKKGLHISLTDYKAIDFELWLKMKRREEKLNKLL